MDFQLKVEFDRNCDKEAYKPHRELIKIPNLRTWGAQGLVTMLIEVAQFQVKIAGFQAKVDKFKE